MALSVCEFAGLERALIGNTIASGKPISSETYEELNHSGLKVQRFKNTD